MTNLRRPLFERLKAGLQEGIAHSKGELTLKTVSIPQAPPEIDGHTIAALRGQAGMSQAVFAKMLNVSPKAVQSWEQGMRKPSHAARRLIQVFSEHPQALCVSAGLPAVALQGVKVEVTRLGRRRIVVTPPGKRRRAGNKAK